MKRWMGIVSLCCLYSSGPVKATENSDESRTFSVLTYEVKSASAENLHKIGLKLNDFDIAGIQSCFAGCETMLEAAQHPNKYYFNQRPQWWSQLNSGLASLSNFPLIEVKKLHFKAQADLVRDNASKGILLMRYNVNGRILDVYNTQIQAGMDQVAAVAREFQALELVDYVELESSEEHAVILIGDFNTKATKAAIKSKLELQDPAETLVDRFEYQFDRVLFRSGSNTVFKPLAFRDMSEKFVDAEGAPLADSAPIAVIFTLK